MNTVARKTKCALAFLVAGVLAVGPVLADKGGKNEGKDRRDEQRGEQRDDRRDDRRNDRSDDKRNERRDDVRRADGQRGHFQQQHQIVVREYYGKQFSRGRCPPGLAKKHNGCMPPGQARRWQVGHPLPRDVIYYSVPQPLVVQIGQPPTGYRYVRVASDILLMAIGTGMIVDAIQDLGNQ